MAGIEEYPLATGEDLRDCHRALAPRPPCRRDDSSIHSGDNKRCRSHARTCRFRHLRHRLPIVFCPLRQVEKLLDKDRSGASWRCDWRRSALTEQRRVNRLRDDSGQGAASGPLEDCAEAPLLE